VHPLARGHLEQVEDRLALAEAVPEHRDRAEIERARPEPHGVDRAQDDRVLAGVCGGIASALVASVALVISWAAPLAVYFANAFPGTNASRIVGLMSLHAIAGVVTIAVLRTYGTAVR